MRARGRPADAAAGGLLVEQPPGKGAWCAPGRPGIVADLRLLGSRCGWECGTRPSGGMLPSRVTVV